MSIFFSNIDAEINGSGILATNATVESTNSIEAAFVAGYYNQYNQVPAGSIKTNYRFDYIPETNYEPNFGIINKIKNLIPETGYIGEKISLAKITNERCFLEEYILRSQVNNLVQCSVSYNSFVPPYNVITPKINSVEYLNDGSVANSWTTYILSNSGYLSVPVYNLEYNFKINWQPVYIIGNKYPQDVKLISAVESIVFSIDQYRNALFTGEPLLNNIFDNNNGNNISVNALSIQCSDNCVATGNISQNSLNIDLSNFLINSVTTNTLISEYVRTTYQATKYY